MLKKFVIERQIPKVGSLGHAELRDVAVNSNAALEKMGEKVQWVESMIAADKTYCFYMAENADDVRKHAQLAGIPATIGVLKTPGRMVLMRMPSFIRSRAIGRVIASTPPFDAE